MAVRKVSLSERCSEVFPAILANQQPGTGRGHEAHEASAQGTSVLAVRQFLAGEPFGWERPDVWLQYR